MANVKKIYDMVVVTGTYTNKSGEEKKEFTNIGKFFVMDDNSFFSKITSIPVKWDGMISYYEQKPKEQAQITTAPQQQYVASAPQKESGIPF